MKKLKFTGERGAIKRNDAALSPGQVFETTDEEAADLLRRSDVVDATPSIEATNEASTDAAQTPAREKKAKG